ncbi:unnamed protein product [Phytomonas sp. Hart1]|nr:unnamed protein product [Phytomonas sp. Hart1]|eukprot:CCW70346.1 unnamed protein product [Phytomonas sp. isolate Hart1]
MDQTTANKLYGGVAVRISDRMMLCKISGVPTENFSIPGTAWAEVVSKCIAPHFRTSSFLNVTSDLDPTKEVQLSYHITTTEAMGFALICGKDVSRRHAQNTLDELTALFNKMFVEDTNKLTPRMVDIFSKPARDVLVKMSSETNGEDKVRRVKQAVDEVKNLALDNVERVLQRGQKIDDIVQATEDLQFQAQGFQRSSRDLRNQLWWNTVKGKLIIGGIAAVFIILVLFTFFSGNSDTSTGK